MKLMPTLLIISLDISSNFVGITSLRRKGDPFASVPPSQRMRLKITSRQENSTPRLV